MDQRPTFPAGAVLASGPFAGLPTHAPASLTVAVSANASSGAPADLGLWLGSQEWPVAATPVRLIPQTEPAVSATAPMRPPARASAGATSVAGGSRALDGAPKVSEEAAGSIARRVAPEPAPGGQTQPARPPPPAAASNNRPSRASQEAASLGRVAQSAGAATSAARTAAAGVRRSAKTRPVAAHTAAAEAASAAATATPPAAPVVLPAVTPAVTPSRAARAAAGSKSSSLIGLQEPASQAAGTGIGEIEETRSAAALGGSLLVGFTAGRGADDAVPAEGALRGVGAGQAAATRRGGRDAVGMGAREAARPACWAHEQVRQQRYVHIWAPPVRMR